MTKKYKNYKTIRNSRIAALSVILFIQNFEKNLTNLILDL